jgi:hypothetical protein
LRYADELSVVLPDSEYQHAQTARARAALEAAQENRAVAVCAAGKPRYIMHPDGSRTAPEGMASVCTRGSDRPCFCPACREERRAARS